MSKTYPFPVFSSRQNMFVLYNLHT